MVFIAYNNGAQLRIERRGTKSWSVVPLRVDDSPFGIINTSEITMTAAALFGDTTLTASSGYFKTEQGSKNYAIFQSVCDTAIKNKQNPLFALQTATII